MTSKTVLAHSLRSPFNHPLTGIFLFGFEKLLNLVANVTVRDLDIIFGGTVVRHEREEVVISNVKLSTVSFDAGNDMAWILTS